MKKIIAIVAIILANAATAYFIAYTKISTEISKLSASMNEKVSNQTALFYRTIGEKIPVVVPEDDKQKFSQLKAKADECFAAETLGTELKSAKELYYDFIRTTAPWIQDELFADISTVKYELDYLSILDDYDKNKDIDNTISMLGDFIFTNSENEKIDVPEKKYEMLVATKKDSYDATIKSLNEEMQNAFAEPKTQIEFWENIAKKTEPYANDENLSENLKKLGEYISECTVYGQIEDELSILQKSLSAEENQTEDLVSVYSQRIALCSYNTESIKLFDNSKILSSIKICSELAKKAETAVKKQSEQEILNELEKSFEYCESEINALAENTTSAALVSVLANALSSLKATAGQLTTVDNSQFMNKIRERENLLNQKEAEITSAIAKNQEKQSEEELFAQIQKSLEVCKSEISELAANTTSTEMIPILATQLANLKNSAANLNIVENTTVLTEIQENIALLNKKETEITDTLIKEGQDKAKETKDKELFAQIKRSFDFCKAEISKLDATTVSLEIIPIFANQLETLKLSAADLEVIDNKNLLSDIQQSLSLLTRKEEEFTKEIEQKQEQATIAQMKNAIATCKNEIQKLDASSSEMISALSAQLASLKIAAGDLENSGGIVNEIESVANALKTKEKSLSDKISDKNEADLRRYNASSLRIIENANTALSQYNKLFNDMKPAQEQEAYKNLILQLEKLQVNYLYVSVQNLYQQVYQAAWNKLNDGKKFEVTRSSVNSNKWGIYDNF